MEELLDSFFSHEFENIINEKMMFRNYDFEYNVVMSYVNRLLDIEYDKYIDYCIDNYNVDYLTSNDVLQYSNYYDATVNVCRVIKANGDTGFRFLEIGKILENDGVIRKDGAYRKYGENQSKFAENIGLLQKIDYTYYLSCIGVILDQLSVENQENLINRLLLRNKFVRRLIYKSFKYGSVVYHTECEGFLKESTIIRRMSNTKIILRKIYNSSEKYKYCIDNIIFE